MKSPITFLGNGSCFNILQGNTSAFFYGEDNCLALIDCGENIFERVYKHKLLNTAKHLVVFVTHMHSDHVGSLPSLLFLASFMPNILSSTVVCDCIEDMKTFLKICGDPKTDIVLCKDWQGKFKIDCTSFDAVHKNMKASSFLFKTMQSFFYFSGDTRIINSGIVQMLKSGEIDAVFHEASRESHGAHTEIRELVNAFEKPLRKKVFCTHIPSTEEETEMRNEGFNIPEILL